MKVYVYFNMNVRFWEKGRRGPINTSRSVLNLSLYTS